MKKKRMKIKLINLIIIIFLILGIAFGSIYFIFYKQKNSNNTEQFNLSDTDNQKMMEELKEKINENKWDTRIVSNLTEDDVPIPNGYMYIQGNKDTGIIIELAEEGVKYLFIPYEKIEENLNEEFYKNVNYKEVDLSVLSSIKKYGGFYVELNSNFGLESLKTISNDDYESLFEQLKYAYGPENNNVTSHMLYKEEILQIGNYFKNNKIDLGDNTIGIQALIIQPFSSINKEELEESTEENKESLGTIDNIEIAQTKLVTTDKTLIATTNNKNNVGKYVYDYNTNSELYGGSSKKEVVVPIPSGFNYCEVEGTVMIQDKNNEKMIYIWVPTTKDDLEDAKNQLKKIYQKQTDSDGEKYDFSKDSDLYKLFENTKEDIDRNLLTSVNKYGGFYVSQAELSKDKDGNYLNLGRGMISSSAKNTTTGGDYIRGSNINKKDIDKICKESNENASVVSHLMYGAEYDSILLWIKNTNENFIDKQKNDINTVLFVNSTYVGKYNNSELKENSSALEIPTFNQIWGLAGNLEELTQERIDSDYITRGGSFANTGEATPIASRIIRNDLLKDEIGIRTVLYIENGLTRYNKSTKGSSFEYEQMDDIIEEENGIKYTLFGDQIRYINTWDGAKVYTDTSMKNELKTLSMGQDVIVNSKATESAKLADGQEIVWVKIKLDNDKYGYMDANDLTDSVTYYGDSIGFVKTGKVVTRYYKEGFTVYSSPDDNDVTFSTEYVGKISIIGKSLDQKWAIADVDGAEKFVHSGDLTVSVDTEQVEDKVFIKGNEKDFYVIEKDVKLYKDPSENNSIKDLSYASKTIINAISEDGMWAKVKDESGEEGYVINNKLSTVKPVIEENNNNSTQQSEEENLDPAENQIKVYVVASNGLNIRKEPNTSSQVIVTSPFRTPLTRLKWGGNGGWDYVTDGVNKGYASNNYLSNVQPVAVSNTVNTSSSSKTSNFSSGYTSVNETVYVNSTIGLNIRSGPGTGYKAITHIDHRTTLTRIGKGSFGWDKVKLSNGTSGYAYSSYLVTTKPTTSSTTATTSQTKYTKEQQTHSEKVGDLTVTFDMSTFPARYKITGWLFKSVGKIQYFTINGFQTLKLNVNDSNGKYTATGYYYPYNNNSFTVTMYTTYKTWSKSIGNKLIN